MKHDLPDSEKRRKYFKEIVEEAHLLFGIEKKEAVEFANRFTSYMQSKLAVNDTVNFGTGKIFAKTMKPRKYNLIKGTGVEDREEVVVGERVVYKVKFFKAKN